MEQIRVDLSDHIVSSMHTIPELKPLVCNWTVLLQVLKNHSKMNRSKRDGRLDAVHQQVLLRMLVRSAELEFGADSSQVAHLLDPDMLALRKAGEPIVKKKRSAVVESHEDFTLSLLHALPDLLGTFKTEPSVLVSLTELPQYFRTYPILSVLPAFPIVSHGMIISSECVQRLHLQARFLEPPFEASRSIRRKHKRPCPSELHHGVDNLSDRRTRSRR